MAITRADIRAAVEKYLPRTVNFAQSADLGEQDRDAIYQRIRQVILTSMLVDKDTVFYLIYLASRRLLESVGEAVSLLDGLEGVDQLRSITEIPPSRLDDLSGLTAARGALLRLSDDLRQDVFGQTALTEFSDSVGAFLEDQVGPNVQGGNQESISQQIQATMAQLLDVWEDVQTRRAALFSMLSSYEGSDLRTQVTAGVITSVRATLLRTESELPGLTTIEQARGAEEVLLDLAAAEAALSLVGLADSAQGAVVVPPSSDGATTAAYLVAEGTATLEPVQPIAKGVDGELDLADVVLVSTTGQTVDDTDGDDTTAELSDGGVPDFTSVASAGDTLTFVDTGSTHVLTNVTPSRLFLQPEVRHQAATAQRYAVTSSAPGTRFRSGPASGPHDANFWDAYSFGRTEGTSVTGGVSGQWVRDDKASGGAGTNLKASASTGTARPEISSGSGDFSSATEFEDSGATFLSDGVVAGMELAIDASGLGPNAGSSFTISSVDSETQVTITGSATISSGEVYVVEKASAEEFFEDLNASFLTDGVGPGDTLEVLNGSFIGSYVVASVVSQTELELTTGPFTSQEVSVIWRIRLGADTFVDEGSTFLSDDVLAGDIINITGVGERVVSSVDSQTQLTLATTISSAVSSAPWTIYASSTVTNLFDHGEGAAINFELLGVDSTIDVSERFFGAAQTVPKPGILSVGGTDYAIERLEPGFESTRLRVATTATVGSGISWGIRAGDETRSFLDGASAPFSSYSPGDIIVIDPSGSASRHAIEEIISADEVVLAEPAPQGLPQGPYAVISKVKPGQELLASSRRYSILDVLGQNTLQVDPPLPNSAGRGIPFQVVLRGSKQFTSRLVDPAGAALYDAAGFGSELVGLRVDIMVDRPIQARLDRVLELSTPGFADGFEVSSSLRPAQRGVAYRILSSRDNSSDALLTSEAAAANALAGDRLTIWGQPEIYTLTGAPSGSYTLPISPRAPARLSSQNFAVTRGGSEFYGRYLIMEGLNDALTIDETTNSLRLRIAEVLIDFGSVVQAVASGAGGSVSDDGDADGVSGVFSAAGATFITAGAAVGDRLRALDGSGEEIRTYVTAVLSETALQVFPELEEGAYPTWDLERNSVSSALGESSRLRGQMEALQDLLEGYVLPPSKTVDGVLRLMQDQQLDRSLDRLLDGKFTEFLAATREQSSYVSSARRSVQSAGSSTAQSTQTSNQVAGVNPATGRVPARTRGMVAGSASSLDLPEESETRTALSEGIEALVSDEKARALAQVSFEELRNRAIYELVGEVESGVNTDTDATLPWIAVAGSLRDQVEARKERLLTALQFMIDNPDSFEEVS